MFYSFFACSLLHLRDDFCSSVVLILYISSACFASVANIYMFIYCSLRWKKLSRGTVQGQEGSFSRTSHFRRFVDNSESTRYTHNNRRVYMNI